MSFLNPQLFSLISEFPILNSPSYNLISPWSILNLPYLTLLPPSLVKNGGFHLKMSSKYCHFQQNVRKRRLHCLQLFPGLHTRHQGYARHYCWTGLQAGHWSCSTRWKWLKTGILFTTLLQMSNMLITNLPVYFTFSGLFKTIQNFSNSGNSLKLGGITIFWSQVSFSSEYLGHMNKKWFSFSIFFSSWFSQTWHILAPLFFL